MKVLVINAGSSSVKYHLYQMPQSKVLARGLVERIGEEISQLSHFFRDKKYTMQTKVGEVKEAMELILKTLVSHKAKVLQKISEIDAVGHRVVHGGEEFTCSVIIDENVIKSIKKFADLAPLHNRSNLEGILYAQQNIPYTKQVACFDTAFHTTMPQVAYTYGLPLELCIKYGIRKYGFHGISHRYVARRVATIMGKDKYKVNLITSHLGNGCSVTAIEKGKSIDTSMGFTPLGGVMMGTRPGDFDPFTLFYLADKGYGLEELKEICTKKSGLLGISGISNDMRILQEYAEKGNERAKLAIDIFCYRVRKYISQYAGVVENLDGIVFTAGIGENSVTIRQQICDGLSGIGIQINPELNKQAVAKELEISARGSRAKVFVIPTDEAKAIAKDTYELVER